MFNMFKEKFIPLVSLVALAMTLFVYQNCANTEFAVEDTEGFLQQSRYDESHLVEILGATKNKIARLSNVNSGNDVRDREALLMSQKLEEAHGLVYRYLENLDGTKLNANSELFAQVDYLVFLNSEAGDYLLVLDLDQIKREVAANRLKIEQLDSSFNEFKTVVLARLNAIDSVVNSMSTRQDSLTSMLDQLRAQTSASDAALQASLLSIKEFTERDLARLFQMNNELSTDILEQRVVLDDLFTSQNELSNIQGQMCTVNSTGVVTDTRTKCSSTLQGDGCCLTVDVVDCSVLFPDSGQSVARSQCEIVMASIKNHDAQLQAIKAVDEKQTELIEGLLNDVSSLNTQVKTLADGQVLLTQALSAMNNKLNAIDSRLLIVEFKTSHAEAAASIKERIELTKAWVLQRQKDVTSRFCSANFHQARKNFDYEKQRQNWDFCRFTLNKLKKAMVQLHNINAFTMGVEALNVDSPCSATINGVAAESLSLSQLTQPATFQEMNQKCTSGAALVKARLVSAVKALETIAPEFRTKSYIEEQAPIAQMLFLDSAIQYTNPTAQASLETVFGQVEGLFKNKYIKNILRNAAGEFPRDAQIIAKALIPRSSEAYTYSEMAGQRLSSKIIEASCSDCSWGVKSRSNAGGVVTGVLTSEMRYPQSINTNLCPVKNDLVIQKEIGSDDYYAYIINYDWNGQERVRGYNRGGSHLKVATSTVNYNSGLRTQRRYWGARTIYKNAIPNLDMLGRFSVRVTQPYGKVYKGKAHCTHFTAAFPMLKRDLTAPTTSHTNLYKYLNGYAATPTSALGKACIKNMGTLSRVREEALDSVDLGRLYLMDATGTQSYTQARRNLVTATSTQLGPNYWVTKDKSFTYGEGGNFESIASGKGFYQVGSTSYNGIHFWRKATSADGITKQECTPNE